MPSTTDNPSLRPHNFLQYGDEVLQGAFLQENPYFQGAVADPLRREAEQAMAAERLRINQAASGAGRFGGDVWGAAQGRAYAGNQQALQDALSGALYQNYGDERTRMNEIAAMLAGYTGQQELGQLQAETAAQQMAAQAEIAAQQIAAQLQAAQMASSSTAAGHRNQLAIAQLQAETQLEALAQQLGFSRQELAGQLGLAMGQQGLDYAGLQQQGDLAALNLLAQMGLGLGSQQLGALGLAGMLEGANYTGLNAAAGLTGQAAAADAAAAAAANQNAQQQWQWEYGQGQQALQNLMQFLLPIAGAGGTTSGTSAGQLIPPGAPAWAQGLSGLLTGTLGAADLLPGGASGWLEGLFGGGGGQQLGAHAFTPGGPDMYAGIEAAFTPGGPDMYAGLDNFPTLGQNQPGSSSWWPGGSSGGFWDPGDPWGWSGHRHEPRGSRGGPSPTPGPRHPHEAAG